MIHCESVAQDMELVKGDVTDAELKWEASEVMRRKTVNLNEE